MLNRNLFEDTLVSSKVCVIKSFSILKYFDQEGEVIKKKIIIPSVFGKCGAWAYFVGAPQENPQLGVGGIIYLMILFTKGSK